MYMDKRPAGGKRLTILLAAVVVFLLLVSTSMAGSPKIFVGKVISGSRYVTQTGEEFSVAAVPPYDRVALELPWDSFVMENKSCSEGKLFRGCYNGASFSGYNYSLTDRLVYELDIEVYALVPEITLTMLTSKTAIDVGERATVYVNITNTGTKKGMAYFTTLIPKGLKLAELPDQPCALSSEGTLSMAAELDDGLMKRCIYEVIGGEPGEYSITAAAEFDALKREKAGSSASLTVKRLPFSISAEYPRQLPLGEQFNLSFNLSSESELSPLLLNALIPKQIKLVSADKEAELKYDNRDAKLSYGGQFTKFNGTITLKIIAEANTAGDFFITGNTTWKYGDLWQQLEAAFPINITFARPYIRLSTYDNKTGVASIDVVNPSHLSISNVSITSGTFSGPAGNGLHTDIVPSQSHTSFYITPSRLERGNLTGLLEYQTPYGQMLSAIFQLPLNASLLNFTPKPAQQKPAQNESMPDFNQSQTGKNDADNQQAPVILESPGRGIPKKFAAAIAAVTLVVAAVFLLARVKREKEALSEIKEGEKLLSEGFYPGKPG